jgi:hypothetical protein
MRFAEGEARQPRASKCSGSRSRLPELAEVKFTTIFSPLQNQGDYSRGEQAWGNIDPVGRIVQIKAVAY